MCNRRTHKSNMRMMKTMRLEIKINSVQFVMNVAKPVEEN